MANILTMMHEDKLKNSPISERILDNLEYVESRNDPLAVNKASGAQGAYQFLPSTVEMLSKKYRPFDPFDRNDARAMAKQYLTDLYHKEGTVEGALKRYGGFIKQNPTNYINKILHGNYPSIKAEAAGTVNAAAPSIQLAATGDDSENVLQLMDRYRQQGATPGAQPAQPQNQPMPTAPAMPAAQQAPVPQTSGALSTIKDIGKGAASLVDNAANIAAGAVGGYQYAKTLAGTAIDDIRAGKPLSQAGSFAKAKQAQNEVTSRFTDPLGRALGITEDPAYKNEATRRALQFIGENLDKPISWLSEKTGLPKEYIENVLGSTTALAGAGIPKIPVGKAVQGQPLPPGMRPSGTPAPGTPGGPRPTIGSEAGRIAKETAQKVGENPILQQIDKTIDNAKNYTQGLFEVKKAPAAPKPPPISDNFTFNGKSPYAEREVSKAKQRENFGLLQRTGAEDVHITVLKGRGKERATMYSIASTDTPVGNVLKNQFDKEMNQVNRYASSLVEDIGGTVGNDQQALKSRGRVIDGAIVKLDKHLGEETSASYALRDAQAKDVPVRLDKTKERLLDPENTTTEELALRDKVLARMKKLDMIDKENNLLNTTAKNAESLRQLVNENKSLARGGLFNRLRDAIDEDVFSSVKGPLYEDARRLHKMRKETIDNPKGISSLIEADGMNRKTPLENVPKKVLSLDSDQLAHVVDVLKNKMPPKLEKSGLEALNAIKAQYLNDLIDAGTKGSGKLVKNWNSEAVTKMLRNSSEDLKILFTKQEIAKIMDLNDLGQLYRVDTGYKGAAVQNINLGRKGLNWASEAAAMAIGEAMTGGVTLGQTGNWLRSRVAARNIRKSEEGVAKKETKKIIPINEIGKKVK